MKPFKQALRYGAIVPLAGAALPSFAAAVDVAGVVTDIAAQAVPVGLVGAAVLLLMVAVKAFRWVRAALS